jgi:hypothetical protein
VTVTRGRDFDAGAGNEDSLFSPMVNPTAPGGEMLGERNADSVLFDVRSLSGDEDEKRSTARAGNSTSTDAAAADARTPEEEASGLIDVKKVLADTPDVEPSSLAIERLTASTSPAEPVVAPPPDRLRTVLLLASIVTLLCVGALLAVKAMS